MITENIGIGNHQTPYDDFDIIVNLNYPANNVEHMEISENISANKLVYNVGIKDTPNENMLEILNLLIPRLLVTYDEKKKILFHCYQGISRSASIATLFVSLIKNISLDESYCLIKNIRSNIAPNPGFIKALYMYKVSNR
jgi:protein-tyrosine phosphatase